MRSPHPQAAPLPMPCCCLRIPWTRPTLYLLLLLLGSMHHSLARRTTARRASSVVPGRMKLMGEPAAAATAEDMMWDSWARCASTTSGGLELPLDDSYMTRAILADSDAQDSLKWALLAHKLQGKSAVTIATFGGSITKGHGVKETETYRHFLERYLEAALPCGAAGVAVDNEGHGGTHPFMSRCQFTRDWGWDWTAADPSSAPAAAAHPPLDLIILEYACNGVGLNHAWSYELLLRSVMARFPTSAILGFGAFWWLQSGKLRDFNKTQYSRVIEEEVRIARHYGFPYLSARDALYYSPLVQAKGTSSLNLISDWVLPDGLHPNALGHQYYAALMARFILRKLGMSGAGGAAQLKPALHQINRAHFGGRNEMCFLPGKANFRAVVLESQGFELGNDGPGLDLKEGYISNSASTMLINASFPLPQFVFSVYLLRGWDNIADARIECVAGCRCKPHALNGTWHQHTTEIVPVLMEVDNSGGGECRIAITTLPEGRHVHQRIAALGMDS